MTGRKFAVALRERQRLFGTWVVCDSPISTESIAGLGYDFICIDGQHGFLDQASWAAALNAIGTGGRSAGIIRVAGNDAALIGRALDSGADGVLVPMIESAGEAEAAVRACRYSPAGARSYGPMRARLRNGGGPVAANENVSCLVMIETAEAIANIDEICAVAGLDGVLVGPFDLTLSLGGSGFGDPAVADRFDEALSTVVAAARRTGVAAGVHCPDGFLAAKRLADGFSFAMVSCDLLLLEDAATAQLRAAQDV